MKSYMYRQGKGWIVGTWDQRVGAWRLSHEMSYWVARQCVGEDNCRHKNDGKCNKVTHDHHREQRGEK